MGQKESHPTQEQINEYYDRRHSFYENPEESKAKLDKGTGGHTKHKRSKSKEIAAQGMSSKQKQQSANVSLQFSDFKVICY